MNRRDIIKGIGAAICAYKVPPFLPELVAKPWPIPDHRLVSGSNVVFNGPATVEIKPVRYVGPEPQVSGKYREQIEAFWDEWSGLTVVSTRWSS